LRFFAEETGTTGCSISIELSIPSFLLEMLNTASNLGELFRTELKNGLFDLLDATHEFILAV